MHDNICSLSFSDKYFFDTQDFSSYTQLSLFNTFHRIFNGEAKEVTSRCQRYC